MHKIGALRKIIRIFCFALMVFSCATTKAPNTNIGLQAEAVPEGVCLTFDNIPPEATRLFIIFQEQNDKEANPARVYDIICSYTNITGDELEQVKQTNKVIFPFVRRGYYYYIAASFEKDGFPLIDEKYNFVSTECVPFSGIFFNRGIRLDLNATLTTASLSAEPVFSTEVCYAPIKYSFYANIDRPDIHGTTRYTDESTVRGPTWWTFEPYITDEAKRTDHLPSGKYTTYIDVYCNLIYDNIIWKVEIAKSREFIFSL